MKKNKTTQLLSKAVLMVGIFTIFTFMSCGEDPIVEDPIASFQFEVNVDNYLEVAFTNYSQNADTYSWDFGDMSAASTEENPVHLYTDAGTYDVVLTATNSDDVSVTFTESIEITDPNAALVVLTGGASKVWKFYREGTSMGIGPDATAGDSWWSLTNDGSRPCIYKQTWTFNHDGTFDYSDGGEFWGEGDLFAGTDYNETCFVATVDNMKKEDGTDISAFMSGTHEFSYDPFTGKLTVTGTGAWLGLIKLGTSDYASGPQETITYDVTFEEFVGYDLMHVSVTYGDQGQYWHFEYVSYSDASLEPELVEEAEVWTGVDLDDITPTEIKVTFASKDAADVVVLDTMASASGIEFGVADPADAAANKVGMYSRFADVSYQELKFQATPDPKDIQFDNFTSLKIDVYFPSSNDYDGTLAKTVEIGFGDISETNNNEWWTDIANQKTSEEVTLDTWTTLTFDLTDAKARVDLDMLYLSMGGGGHAAGGTFYVRNLIFE